jgi:hypothetical protein
MNRETKMKGKTMKAYLVLSLKEIRELAAKARQTSKFIYDGKCVGKSTVIIHLETVDGHSVDGHEQIRIISVY